MAVTYRFGPPPGSPMPRRWPSVTISMAGTSPSTVPAASTTVRRRNGMRAPEERLAPAGLGDEAHVLAVGLRRGAQPERRRPVAHLGLGEMPDREQRAPQLALREHVHDVALVLRRVGAAMHEVAVADGLDAGVVAGGDRIESEQVGALAEPIELQVPVALDARVRRRALDCGPARTDRRRAC